VIRALALAILLPILPQSSLAQSVVEPADYRSDPYRDAVPATLKGARVVDSEEAHAIWKAGKTAFVDVIPRPPKPEGLPEGTIWREKPRYSIPGAIWLPNVGYDRIADVTHDYFKAGLAQVTGGDLSYPVLIFCLEDCWMSWNAAKRALEYGYTDVIWYPTGTDGWSFFDFPLEKVERAILE